MREKEPLDQFTLKISVSPKKVVAKNYLYSGPKHGYFAPDLKKARMKNVKANLVNFSLLPSLIKPQTPLYAKPKTLLFLGDEKLNRNASLRIEKRRLCRLVSYKPCMSRTLNKEQHYTDLHPLQHKKQTQETAKYLPCPMLRVSRRLYLSKPTFDSSPKTPIFPHSTRPLRSLIKVLPARKFHIRSQLDRYLRQACDSYHLQRIDRVKNTSF